MPVSVKRIHDDQIAIIEIDVPPINALDHEVRSTLLHSLQTLSEDSSARALILTGIGRLFSGGVDIREFGTERWSALLLGDLCDAFEAFSGLLVMALNGTALGGGLELALTGDYRIAPAECHLGLPEVKLGLVPGAGGTQRLPRRVGPVLALSMIATGETIPAPRALAHGLLDRIVPNGRGFMPAAVQYTRDLLRVGAPRRRVDDQLLRVPDAEFADARCQGDTSRPGCTAKRRGIELVDAARRLPLADGLALERQVFDQCVASPEFRSLRHLFFAERAARKVPDISPSTSVRSISRVGIVGAGTMGTGIALACLAAGLAVTLVECSPDALERGFERIQAALQSSVARKRLSPESAAQQMASLHLATTVAELATTDLVIEAVYEDYALKERVFAELDRSCREGCIIASNTSTLDLDRLAASTSRPADVVGLHFFSPAHVMRLLEIVRTRHASAEVLRTCLDFGCRLQKIPVVVGVGFGFVGNRMMEPYTREAQRLVLEGANPSQVDAVLTRFGMAMGPLAVLDLAGLDVTYRIRQSRRAEISHDPSYAALGDELYRLHRYGQKSGRGFYHYSGRERQEDPEIVTIAQSLARTLGVPQRPVSDTEILERCLYSLIDEGCRVIEEGIASRASDCDVVYVHGYGFPSWRGGPMHYADAIGLDVVASALDRYRTALGDYGKQWFQASELLQRLVGESRPLGSAASATASRDI